MAARLAAVYARYSSDNQAETSIDDQISICRTYAEQNDFIISEEHIYSDYAVSGTRRHRDGWSALKAAGAAQRFRVVLVEDFSRVSRSLEFLLADVSDLRYVGIGVVSVTDGVDTLNEDMLIALQFRGIIVEV